MSLFSPCPHNKWIDNEDGTKELWWGYTIEDRFYGVRVEKDKCMYCGRYACNSNLCEICRPEMCINCNRHLSISQHLNIYTDPVSCYWTCIHCDQIYPHLDDIKEPDC